MSGVFAEMAKMTCRCGCFITRHTVTVGDESKGLYCRGGEDGHKCPGLIVDVDGVSFTDLRPLLRYLTKKERARRESSSTEAMQCADIREPPEFWGATPSAVVHSVVSTEAVGDTACSACKEFIMDGPCVVVKWNLPTGERFETLHVDCNTHEITAVGFVDVTPQPLLPRAGAANPAQASAPNGGNTHRGQPPPWPSFPAWLAESTETSHTPFSLPGGTVLNPHPSPALKAATENATPDVRDLLYRTEWMVRHAGLLLDEVVENPDVTGDMMAALLAPELMDPKHSPTTEWTTLEKYGCLTCGHAASAHLPTTVGNMTTAECHEQTAAGFCDCADFNPPPDDDEDDAAVQP